MKSQLSNIKLRSVLLGLLLMVLSCSSAVWAQEQVKHSPAQYFCASRNKSRLPPHNSRQTR